MGSILIKKRKSLSLLVFPLVALLLFVCSVGCIPEQDIITDIRQDTSTANPTPTPSLNVELTMVPIQPTITSLPSFTPNPTATHLPPTPLPTSGVMAACELNPQSILSVSDPLENVILFVSNSSEPLTKMDVLTEIPPIYGRDYDSQLWAISPDGLQANRLTMEGHGIAWHLPESSTLPVWLMSSTDFKVDETLIRQIPLPPACNDFLEEYRNLYSVCGDFEISSDGKWASFSLGDYLTGYELQSGLINLETGEIQLPTIGTGLMWFLPNNERLVFYSWGEGGQVWWTNSLTGEAVRLGEGGPAYWNKDETAFAVDWSPYVGLGGAVWAYDTPTKSLFVAESLPEFASTHPVWSPDDSILLYHQQSITHTGTYTLTFGPREIHMADIVTGDDRIVLSSPQSNYYLCDEYGVKYCVWAGDWIRVRRLPYHVKELYIEDYDSCILYGIGCSDPVENLALNWRTGEVTDWEKVAHLLLAPTAIPSTGPDLAATPIYTNAKIGYALYAGLDSSSLWCVPEGGAPQLWIQDAEWFVYLP